MASGAVANVAHWIDGEKVGEADGPFESVTNSATGEEVARVPLADQTRWTRAAVAAADSAFDSWSHQPLGRRARIFFRFREILDRRRDELVDLIVREHGKVREDASGEVQRGIEVVEFACGIPHLLKGEFSPDVSTNTDVHSFRKPLGVMAGISPFNFPAMVPMWMFPVAIACGNTFVLKPSEKDPSISLVLAQAFQEAGLPDGVFNVVQGSKEAVDELLGNPSVRAISFVGSTPIARHVYSSAAAAGKRVQALGGAKNHLVALPDADEDVVADALVSSAYGSAGERCMAISAAVLVGAAGDRVVAALEERLRRLRVGPGWVDDNEMGPLVTAAHRERVASYIDVGVSEGATLVYDGRKHPVDGPEGGHWLGPTLFDDVSTEMTIYREEIFGPVLSVVRADSLDEAIEIVNGNPWGNGTAIFTTSGDAARRFADETTVGMVGVNVPIPVPMAYYSFGGWKDSLFGDLHVHGREGVLFATQGKVVTSQWHRYRGRGMEKGFPSSVQ